MFRSCELLTMAAVAVAFGSCFGRCRHKFALYDIAERATAGEALSKSFQKPAALRTLSGTAKDGG